MLRGPKTTSCHENNPSKAEVSIVMGVGHEGAGAGARAPELLGQYPGDARQAGAWTPGHLVTSHTWPPSAASPSHQQPASTCPCQMR